MSFYFKADCSFQLLNPRPPNYASKSLETVSSLDPIIPESLHSDQMNITQDMILWIQEMTQDLDLWTFSSIYTD